MPDKAEEMRHLAEADEHIRRGARTVADLTALVAAQNSRGADSAEARQTLATAEDSLAEMRLHRAHIVQTIRDLDAGVL